ncbi:MAG TPA: 16S rRNA (adenine(1518)-N(6)/adenine(1519)-N(6))-dimethyltransferase RsmA [Actinomycetota bacterium]|nr:16S rRNA (adenine(1518)-N(6)/adenine(1519)-N(6))-dimethyltransferase RsmA [Actinomycetota bacterium]
MTAPPLLGARRLRALLDAHGVTLRKQLGQNFVVDPNTIRKVVAAAAIRPGDRVLEIGAGAGSLTLGLATAGARVVALEVDARLLPVLRDVVGGRGDVEIVHADARTADLDAFGARRVVANLPYNAAATIVLRVLEAAPGIDDLTVMTQLEVGERLVARPGDDAYGQTSVFVTYWADATLGGRVSRRAFFPVPGVDSVLVRIVRRRSHVPIDRALLFDVVRAAFSQRRKTLRNSLAARAGGVDAAAAAALRAGVDPAARAEDLGLESFVALARALS